MTATPVARLVVAIFGGVLLLVVGASVIGSLMRGEPVAADAWDVAKVAAGFVGGVLAKTGYDAVTQEGAVAVHMTNPEDDPAHVAVADESVRPPDVEA